MLLGCGIVSNARWQKAEYHILEKHHEGALVVVRPNAVEYMDALQWNGI